MLSENTHLEKSQFCFEILNGWLIYLLEPQAYGFKNILEMHSIFKLGGMLNFSGLLNSRLAESIFYACLVFFVV